ncbi:MAG: 3-methyl-2-oxobutanoate hydroxymethyltransferase [Nanoarchaeota archaeon]
MKKNIIDFNKMKQDNIPVSWLTSYSYWQSKAAQNAGIDMILCGDSYGNVECGYSTTNPVSLKQMLQVTQNVRKGADTTFIVGDFNFGCYESSNKEAINSAVQFIKSGADAIKLERASKTILDRIKAISDIGILIFAHLGVTPQTALNLTGGYRCAGKTKESFDIIYEESLKVQEAGANFLLLEGMSELSSKQIAKTLKIPVYGIGAGQTNGCLMIFHDLLGLFPDFRPYFSKCYIPEVIQEFNNYLKQNKDNLKKLGRDTRTDGLLYLAELAIKKYIQEVKSGEFPNKDYIYPLKEEELNELRKSNYWDPKLE